MKLRIWRSAAALLLAVLFTSAPLWAQTVVTSTTLGAAVTTTAAGTIAVASATGFTANTTFALVDKELMIVNAVNGLVVSVTRGADGTRPATHISGATVWVGPGVAFNKYTPSGQCTRTLLQYVPFIVAGDRDPLNNGILFDCLGLTTAGQWVRVSESGGTPILGTTVASPAGVMTATGTIFIVSGTAAITGITLPAGWAPGVSLYIVPSGVFTWTTATNIAIAGTAVVNKLLIFTWSGTKWVPSYIA
jgi:hypothetical protein